MRQIALAALILVAIFPALAQEGGTETLRELYLPAPDDSSASFRFLPDGPELPFDRLLRLSAAPGEERNYSLELHTRGGVQRRDLLIDRRPPALPRASLQGGAYVGPLALTLSTEPGATLRYALSGPDQAFDGFRDYVPGSRLNLDLVPGSTATYTLVCYALDAVGNKSEELRQNYRVASEGQPLEFPSESPPMEPRPDPTVDIDKLLVRASDGYTRVVLPNAPRGQWVAAVSPGAKLATRPVWASLARDGELSYLDVEGPYGWSGQLEVFFGLDLGGIISYLTKPLSIKVSDLGETGRRVPPPETPRVIDSPDGSSSLLIFPEYEGKILVSVDGAAEQFYQEALALGPASEAHRLSWRGRDWQGHVSETKTIDLKLPYRFPSDPIPGIEGPERRSTALHLRAAPGLVLRYEVSKDGSVPPEPSASSSLLDGELLLDSPPGTTSSYKLRYRVFADSSAEALGGESFLRSLVIDRDPPAPPKLSPAPPYSRQAITLSFAKTQDRLFISASEDENERSWREGQDPVILTGSDEGPRYWYVSAYTRDEAGNSSPVLGPLRFVVDNSSFYVDAAAKTGGDGSRDHPFSRLEDALLLAQDRPKQAIVVRGDIGLSEPLVLDSGALNLIGGHDEGWYPNRSDSKIFLPPSSPGRPSLSITQASLSLRDLSLVADRSEDRLIALRGAKLELLSSTISAQTASNLLLLFLDGSKLSLSDSQLILDGKGGGALISGAESDIRIERSDLRSGEAVDYFTGLALEAGSLVFLDSRLRSQAGISLVGLSLSAADLVFDRSAIEVMGAQGYLRLGLFTSTKGELRNSRFTTESSSSADLFELGNSDLGFVYDTFLAADSVSTLFFRARGGSPRLFNDLIIATGKGAGLLDSDLEPEKGSIVACGFSGLGSYLTGIRKIGDLASLTRLYSGTGLPPHVALSTALTLGRPPKSLAIPTRESPLIDAAWALPGQTYSKDFSGRDRPSAFGRGLPDIGADELQ